MKLLLENWRQYLNEEEIFSLLEDQRSFRAELPGTLKRFFMKDSQENQRLLKRLWNKHVDRELINSLTLVRWTAVSKMQRFFQYDAGREMSAEGYLPNEELVPLFLRRKYPEEAQNAVGFVLGGHVTLASNMNISTGFDQKMKRPNFISVVIQSLILDQESFTPLSKRLQRGNNEVIIANWEITGIVAFGGETNTNLEMVRAISQKYNLPLMDQNKKEIPSEGASPL
tara:strand:- start:1737 stop:2417 length:681 start_codon:yes stop_codon:yes gene_type:complete